MPALVTQPSNDSNGATGISDNGSLSLEDWMSTFATANCHSFLHKMYNWETRQWYYILYYRGDLPYSSLSDEGRHFVKTIQPQKLVVERGSPQGARFGEMRFEMWPTSSKRLNSCHYRCMWRIPVARLRDWEEMEEESGDSGNLEDSGYNSADVGHIEGEDVMEEGVEENGRLKGEDAAEIDARYGEKDEEDEDLPYLERVFPVAFQVILWSHPPCKGKYYTRCTKSNSGYRIRWELEQDATNIAAIKVAQGKVELGDWSEESLMSISREQYLLQLLDDVVGRHPFQHNNLKDTLWRYSRRFRLDV